MGTSVSRAALARIRTAFVACATFALALGLAPLASFAADTPMLASSLLDGSTVIVSEDVELVAVDDDDASATIEPVIGSFTVDGLTFALSDDGVTLVSVSPDAMRASGPDGGRGEVAPEGTSFASEPSEPSASSGPLAIPSNVSYDGVTYDVTAIGSYAFYLSGATQVDLPASIASVDGRAFRSSDVDRVDVAVDNPNIASYDGCLYDSQLTSLLLIPEGRAGSVSIPSEAEVVEASKFSHCSLVDAISVDGDGAAVSSWEGLLYDASGQTLLRVPAGAVDITIREGCTTIAAGAMEGCAKLERINAPASVTSISPDIFESVPTVSFPIASALAGNPAGVEDEAEVSPRRVGSSSQGLSEPLALPNLGSTSASSSTSEQLTAVVTLAAQDGFMSMVAPAAVTVTVPIEAAAVSWESLGFSVDVVGSIASINNAAFYNAYNVTLDAGAGATIFDAQFINNGANIVNTGLQKKTYSYVGYTVWCIPIVDMNDALTTAWRAEVYKKGYYFTGWSGVVNVPRQNTAATSKGIPTNGTLYANWAKNTYNITYDLAGGSLTNPNPTSYQVDTPSFKLENPTREGYVFAGWQGVYTGLSPQGAARDWKYMDGISVTPNRTTEIDIEDPFNVWVEQNSETSNRIYTATWARAVDIVFDTSSEPGGENYLGEDKPDMKDVPVDAGQVEIEDPKRPGYVFEGWVIPTEDGTEAIDQDLVYQGDDGKWYVDASKLPDYATDGKVELTARWTSIISVDVPSAVTFYADVVTQDKDTDDNQKSLDGVADNAFGQAKVTSQSQIDLRIVGLESEAAEGDGANSLGASDVLVDKASASVPASSGWKLFSLFPSSEQLTADDLQDPSRISAQPEGGVTFDIDDLLLEKSFSAEDFTIPAGETLSLGYRLNLKETQQALDYDKLSTLEDGQSASIANISYCFAADYGPVFWTEDDDGSTMTLADIKADAEAIAAGDTALTAKYTRWMKEDRRFHIKWYDKGISEADNPTAATVYEARIIGVNHDDKSDGSGKAGLTFQFVNSLSKARPVNTNYSNAGGWGASTLCQALNGGDLWEQVPLSVRAALLAVDKKYYAGPLSGNPALKTSSDKIFLASYSEVVSSSYASGFNSLGNEGALYAFWAAKHTVGNSANATLVKYALGANGSVNATPWSWWLRSAYIKDTPYCFVYVDGAPNLNAGAIATGPGGIVPCFCL